MRFAPFIFFGLKAGIFSQVMFLFHSVCRSMDSNHKLIHYRIVIHGCVDGFSRKIIYLNAASDNKADTVLQMFYKGMEESGIPVRVRGDKGSENARVKDCMQELRPNIVQPFIQGRSVHNVRIGRLWKETNMHPTWKFKQIFKYLESIELLDYKNITFHIVQEITINIIFLRYEQRPQGWTTFD